MSVMTTGARTGMNVDRLCSIVGYRLSDEQLDAVTADLSEPLRIVAGAGSGKTSVMAARVVWAVGQGHIAPENVLGLTFTTKAASELAARVRLLLNRLQDAIGDVRPPAAGGVPDLGPGEPQVMTYHSFAHQLVAEHGLRIGIEPGSRLLAGNETAHLAFRVLNRTKLPLSEMPSGPSGLVAAVVALDQQLAEHRVSTDQLRAHDRLLLTKVDALTKTVAKDRELRAAAARRLQLADVVDELRAAKLRADAVDFADLLRFGAQLAVEHPEVAALQREQFGLVLLDEYQDTSVVQSDLLSGLFGKGHPVTAVGDPLQGIYGWRGASAEAMEAFSREFALPDGTEPRTCQLSISHRSGARVLEVANSVAQPLRQIHPTVVTLAPAVDEAGHARPDGVRASLHLTHADEVEWVADRVAEQLTAGTVPDQIAILCRAVGDFTPIAEALSRRSIPAQVSSVEGLLAQPEVIDIVSTLEVLTDPTANPAALRLLLGPRWRIGARDLAILGRRAAELARPDLRAASDRAASDPDQTASGGSEADRRLAEALAGTDPVDVVSLAEAIDDPGGPQRFPYSVDARRRFAQLSAELKTLRASLGTALPDLVQQVISTLGLDVEAALAARSASMAQPRAMAALSGFCELTGAFASLDGDTSLGGFLAWTRAVAQFGGSPELELAPQAGSVQILTVHKAKGLEWDVVAVPFLSRQVFPSAKARSRWTTSSAELPHALRGDRDALPDLRGFGSKNHDEFAAALKRHSEAEERRLAYVAVTRPARLLIASGHWWGPTQKTPRGPSDYLECVRELASMPEADGWEPMPLEESNPFLEQAAVYQWPAPVDPDRAAARTAAAALVANPDESADAAEAQLSLEEQNLVAAWDEDLRALAAERAAAAAPRTVALPAGLTATELMALAADPAAFASELARPMPRQPSQAARRGTRFHAWVEQRFGQHPLFDEIPGAADADLFTDFELLDLQEGFLRTEFADRIPFAVEVPFALSLGGRIVRGRIDAVYSDGNRWQVIDWKTSESASADPLQLAIYRAAWAQQRGVEPTAVDAAFVYVRRSETIWHRDLPEARQLARLLTAEPESEVDIRTKRTVVTDQHLN